MDNYSLFYTFHFYLFGVIALVSAITFVTRKSPVAAAMWLVVTMFCLAALYVMLDAQFIGAMQVLVYAGAIMVVFLFVIMLLNLGHPSELVDARGPGAGHDRGGGPAAVHGLPRPLRDHQHSAARGDRRCGRARQAEPVMLLGPALTVSGVLFALGVLGVLLRRNAIVIFMCVELMLNAANLAFVAFAQQLGVAGQIFVFFVMAVAAAEAAVGLAIILAVYRHRHTVDLQNINLLKG